MFLSHMHANFYTRHVLDDARERRVWPGGAGGLSGRGITFVCRPARNWDFVWRRALSLCVLQVVCKNERLHHGGNRADQMMSKIIYIVGLSAEDKNQHRNPVTDDVLGPCSLCNG